VVGIRISFGFRISDFGFNSMSVHPGFGSHTDPTFRSRPRPTGEVIRRVGIYLRPYKLMVVSTVGCAILSLASGFVYPKLIGFVIDGVIRPGRLELLLPAALGLIGAFLLQNVFNSVRIRINNRL